MCVSISEWSRWPSGKDFASHEGESRIGPRHRYCFLFYLEIFLSGVGVPVPGCALWRIYIGPDTFVHGLNVSTNLS